MKYVLPLQDNAPIRERRISAHADPMVVSIDDHLLPHIAMEHACRRKDVHIANAGCCRMIGQGPIQLWPVGIIPRTRGSNLRVIEIGKRPGTNVAGIEDVINLQRVGQGNLMERGLNFTKQRLTIVDGSKPSGPLSATTPGDATWFGEPRNFQRKS